MFTPSTLKRLLLTAALIIQLESRAAVLLEFDNGTILPNSVTISPGETFAFDVYLTSTSQQTVGLTYFLSVSTAGDFSNPGSGKFTITGRNISGSSYSDLQTSNSTFLLAANAVLDPQNNSDAGGLEPDLAALAPDRYFVATFTIQSLVSVVDGVYQLNFANAVYIDEIFEPYSIDTLGSFIVTVVPEPNSLILALIGGLGAMILVSRRRKAVV